MIKSHKIKYILIVNEIFIYKVMIKYIYKKQKNLDSHKKDDQIQ